MLSSAETLRPLPPAKARRVTTLKLSSTPPPAYNSPLTFPSRRKSRQDILGDPNFHMTGWDNDSASSPSSPPLGEELLVTDRGPYSFRRCNGLMMIYLPLFIPAEFDLSSESASLYYQNITSLKSRHDALLSEFPNSLTSSPDGPPYMLSRIMNYSTSDSALGVIASSHSSLIKRLDQKVTADISLLADQNAELMDKLGKLEAGASSSDQTGRRELKRLEKEITFLREALEKTQAKSEELEEKVHGAVTGEAWRKKQEREAKFRAMRYSGRYTNRHEGDSIVQNFAPDGSRFGGPSEGFSFLPSAASSNLRHTRRNQTSDSDIELDLSGLLPHLEHTLISQLLVKVQELEEANAQILKQQSETATQLSAVQRNTEHFSKAYESRADPLAVEPQIEPDATAFQREQLSSTESVKIIGRNSAVSSPEGEEGFFPRDFVPAAKDRKSVMGLFPPDYPLVIDSNLPNLHNLQIPSRPSSPSWSENLQDPLSSSSTSYMGQESPGSLSSLHFFSPATQGPQDLSPLESRPTLQSELSKEFGVSWDMSPVTHHSRTSSLYDLSQFSVPATPCPASHTMSRRASEELNFEIVNKGGGPSLPVKAGLLRLSVESPTPIKGGDIGGHAKSPRVQRMSQTLRSRTGQWVDRRFKDGHHSIEATFNGTGSEALVNPTTSVGLPQLLSDAIDKMIEKLDGFPDVDESKSNTTSPSLVSADDDALRRGVTPSLARKESSTTRKKNVLGNLLFEVWLWFQFTIIIFAFIYAMAKRGPKGVLLVEAERRRPMASSAR